MRRTIENALDDIGAEYASAPLLDAEHAALWRAFATYNRSEADIIRRRLTVIETLNPEPYVDSAAQSADIDRGVFYVSRAHCDHPVWSVDDNVAFRIAHDVLGHHPIGGSFDRHGELAVYRASLAHVPERFHPALFTESIGQLAYACLSGDFGPQKVYVSAHYGKVN